MEKGKPCEFHVEGAADLPINTMLIAAPYLGHPFRIGNALCLDGPVYESIAYQKSNSVPTPLAISRRSIRRHKSRRPRSDRQIHNAGSFLYQSETKLNPTHQD